MKRTAHEKGQEPVHTADPLHSLQRVQEAMDRLFSNHMLQPFRSWPNQQLFDSTNTDLMPRVDISETDTEVKVRAEVPGIDPQEVVLEVTEDTLSLSGTVERSVEERQESYYRMERGIGRFAREFILPCKIDTSTARAETKNGIITVTLTKQQSEQRQRIAITATT